MTRGTKIITTLFLIAAVLGQVVILVGLFPTTPQLDTVSKVTTIIGVLIAFGALIVAAAEYYRKKDVDAKESRPYVIASLVPKLSSPNIFLLRIENTGKTLAKNISIEISPDYRPFEGVKSMSELGILRNFGMLTSGERREFFFGNYLNSPDADNTIRKEFKITVRYQNVEGKIYEPEVFACDPSDYEGMLQSTQKGLEDINKTLEKIAGTQEGIFKSHKKLTDAIIDDGIRVRNVHLVGRSADELLNLVIGVYENHGESELWLRPTAYDFKLIIQQCRDFILATDRVNSKDALVTEMNFILEKDWRWKAEEVDAHFKNIISLSKGVVKLHD